MRRDFEIGKSYGSWKLRVPVQVKYNEYSPNTTGRQTLFLRSLAKSREYEAYESFLAFARLEP